MDNIESRFEKISATAAANELDGKRLTGFKPKILPTGFNDLDKILGGGLRAGLYVIGADTGLGKTSFALQVAHQIAAQGQPVYYVSLEMAREELIAKAISRKTYLLSNERYGNNKCAKSHIRILNTHEYNKFSNDEIDILNESFLDEEIHYKHLYIEEGVSSITISDVKKSIEDLAQHIRDENKKDIELFKNAFEAQLEKATSDEQRKNIELKRNLALEDYQRIESTPVIIIDYLQIIRPERDFEKCSDKMILDHNIVELKRMSRDLETPIIAISSFNRESYSEPVTLKAFKESGCIEYTADVVIGLQFNGIDKQGGEDEKKRKERVVKLIDENNERARQGKPELLDIRILKNRHGHKGTLPIMFNPMYNDFKEPTENEIAGIIGIQRAIRSF